MQDFKPQRAIESDRSWHFVGTQCDRVDALDHGQFSRLIPGAAGIATCKESRLANELSTLHGTSSKCLSGGLF
jgi:hypothetical protein